MERSVVDLKRLEVLLYKEYLVIKKNAFSTLLIAVIIPAAVCYTLLILIPTDAEKIVKANRPTGGEFKTSYKTMVPSELTFIRPFLFCSSLFDNSSVYYYPNNELTRKLMEKVQMKCTGITPVPHNDSTLMETELRNSIKAKEYNRPMAGIIFHKTDNPSRTLHYDIIPTYYAEKNEPFRPEKMSPVSLISLYNIFPTYIMSGFVALQIYLNEAFIELSSSVEHNVNSAFQYAKIDLHEDFVLLIPVMVFNAIFIAMLLPMLHFLKKIFDEKSSDMKQFLKQMSMGEVEYWLAKFIVLSLLFLFLTTYIVVLLSFETKKRISLSLMFVIIFVYFISSLFMAMFTSVFFDRTIVGLSTFLAFQLASTTPFWRTIKKPGLEDFTLFQGEIAYPETVHLLLCVIATPNYSLMLLLFIVLEGSFYSKASSYDPSAAAFAPKWSNVFSVPPHYTLLSPGSIMIAMTISCLMWLLALWFLSTETTTRVMNKGCYELFYDISKSRSKSEKEKSQRKHIKKSREYFEREPSLKKGVVITNLVKKFGDKRPSVNNLSLTLYYGQITVLLGHNGAGKTTLMSMITGMFPPTSGTIKINGFDLVRDTDKAKRNVGLCPQKTLLYPDFSVEEHLLIFGILKGFPKEGIQEELRRVLDLLDLNEKRSVNARELSGGMQRKLQIGIAIVGGCDILILDEPSSGLDIESRRIIWDFLISIRDNFLIFMTTHHMEEADCLGDRIVIMSEGEVFCSGSCKFLKRIFNVGYHLRILTSSQNKTAIHKFVKENLNGVKIENETANEVVYRFPQTESEKLPQFFKKIDANSKKLKIQSYGVNVTSLDDVFIESFTLFREKGMKWTTPKHLKFEETEPVKQIFLLSPLILKRLQIENKRIDTFITFLLLSFIATFVSFAILKSGAERVPYYTDEFEQELNFTAVGYNATKAFCYEVNVSFCESYTRTARKFNVNTTTLDSDDPWRYTSKIVKDHKNYNSYLKTVLSGASVSQSNTSNNFYYVVWYNEFAPSSLPISISILHNAVLQNVTNDENAEIKTKNHAFSNELYTRSFDKVYQYGIDVYTMPWIMLLAFVLSAPFATSFATNEYVSKASVFSWLKQLMIYFFQTKLLQFMSGVTPATYWCANFIFDFIYLMIVFSPFWIVVHTVYFSQVFYLNSGSAIFYGFLGFVLCTISTNYLLSFFFMPTTVYYVVVIFSAIPVTVINVVILLISMFENAAHFSVVAETCLVVLRVTCRFSPFWLFTEIVVRVTKAINSIEVCKSVPINLLRFFCNYKAPFFDVCCRYKCGKPCFEEEYDSFSHPVDGVLYEIKFLYTLCAIQMFAILFLEWNLLKKRFSRRMPTLVGQDAGVAKERKRIDLMVEERETDSDALVSHNLSKSYASMATFKEVQTVVRDPNRVLRTLVAVNQLSFGLHKNEVLGFLGVNGAGKTTAFQLLVGDLFPSFGDAFIGLLSLKSDLRTYQKHIGYCPQIDALIDFLTGKESLEFFAKVRGVRNDKLDAIVNQIIHLMDLDKFADIQCNVYSGGNKRKLVLGMALIGSPNVLLLDEPTTGVDPVARRRMWKAIEHYKKSNKTGAVMLTTHSMDECEALCNRIAILYGGELQCIGTIQGLKKRFRQGFTVYMKMKRGASSFNDVDRYMKNFKNAVCTSNHQPVVTYQINDTKITVLQIYEAMEVAKNKFNLEEYDVNQTSLEQIFLHFVSNQ